MMGIDRSHIWNSSHPEPSSRWSEIVAAGNMPIMTLNWWGSLHRKGSNIKSREMIVGKVDSHISPTPVQVLNQTSNGRGERGRSQGAAPWWRNQSPGSPVLVFSTKRNKEIWVQHRLYQRFISCYLPLIWPTADFRYCPRDGLFRSCSWCL